MKSLFSHQLQMLDAVVVTGYQTVERRKLTAAVGKLNISDETIGAVKSIDQALAGQIAGLSVTSTSGAPVHLQNTYSWNFVIERNSGSIVGIGWYSVGRYGCTSVECIE